MSDKLLECICGGEAIDYSHRSGRMQEYLYWVTCDSCEAQTPAVAKYTNSIEMWNAMQKAVEE